MNVIYEIRKTEDRGLGIFACRSIKKGEKIWDFDKANISIFNEKNAYELCKKNDKDIVDILSYSYWIPGNMLVDIREDDGRFFNHSLEPNCGFSCGSGYGSSCGSGYGSNNDNSTYAIRDIAKDEELLDNYLTYETGPEWYEELLDKYIDQSYLRG